MKALTVGWVIYLLGVVSYSSVFTILIHKQEDKSTKASLTVMAMGLLAIQVMLVLNDNTLTGVLGAPLIVTALVSVLLGWHKRPTSKPMKESSNGKV